MKQHKAQETITVRNANKCEIKDIFLQAVDIEFNGKSTISRLETKIIMKW